MSDLDNIKEEVTESSEKDKKELVIDPRILSAIKCLELSFDNSRAYSDTVDTEEKRLEQLKRVQKALDDAAYKEAAAYWNPISNKPLHK